MRGRGLRSHQPVGGTGNYAQTLYRSEGFALTQAGHGRDTMVKRLR
jgi:hypothetical protein